MSASEFRSNADARLRAEVAACSRILVMENLLDYSGHVSARVPGEEAYYIQAGADPRSELDPNRLIKVDFEGNVVGGANLKPPIEIPIHGEIYKARPDVNAVLHCHMDLAIAFTLMEDVQLMPMRSRAIRWQSGIPTNPDPSHIRTK
ncbi:MAG: class II aldolase/adducin family protein, partial [Alphaproteobacteria bacterium]|nr:class II aldolase/adducin family protein [Alphaproteobacteria bacterium]